MMKKGLLLVVCASMATFASASFELALIYEYDSSSIVRYDPVTNTRLGSFGAYDLGYYSNPALSLDPARPGQLAVLNGDGGIRRFNYSTGEYLSGFSIRTSFYSNTQMQLQMLSNGNALVTGYFADVSAPQTRLYNGTSGALIATMHEFTYDHLAAGQSSDGSIWTLARTKSGSDYVFYYFRYSSAGVYLGFGNAGSSTNAADWYSMRVQGNQLYALGAGPNVNLQKGTISGSSLTVTSLLSGNYYYTELMDNISFGHNGRMHFTQSYSNGTDFTNRWYTVDPVTGYFRSTKLMPYNSALGSMALVVAPEPATMLGLGAGLAAVVSRRRKRSSK